MHRGSGSQSTDTNCNQSINNTSPIESAYRLQPCWLLAREVISAKAIAWHWLTVVFILIAHDLNSINDDSCVLLARRNKVTTLALEVRLSLLNSTRLIVIIRAHCWVRGLVTHTGAFIKKLIQFVC